MAIQGEARYHGTVREGSNLFESQGKGTLGFQVMLSCDDGNTDFVIWLTPKNRDRALQYFEVLGIKPEQLQDRYFVEYTLPQQIIGIELDFGTKTEIWQDRPQVKVAWIGKRRAESESQMAEDMVKFFGGAPAPPPDDDDIPF